MTANKISKESISYDHSEWEVFKMGELYSHWRTQTKDAVLLRFIPDPPTFTFDFNDIENAIKSYTEQSIKNGGVMLSVTFENVAGLKAVKGIFKYRSPEPRSLAMYYVGILVFLFQDFYFQFNTESVERGITGAREAAVAIIRDEKPDPSKKPIEVKSMEEYYDLLRKYPVRKLASDNEEYDSAFPDHPLTKVRGLQNHLIKTISIDPLLIQCKPYSYKKKWWKFF